MKKTAVRPGRSGLWNVILIFALFPSFPLAGRPQNAELLSRPENFERNRDYDALHYRLRMVFDDSTKSCLAENTVTLSSLQDGLRVCFLDAEDLAVTSVVDLAGLTLSFTQTDKKLSVSLAKPAAYGETVSFTVVYTLKNPKTGLKFIEESADHPAQINTYSWPEDAHHWFPCYDYPNDKATSEVLATVRSDWKVLSNGRLEGVSEDGTGLTKTFHWVQEKPHPTYCIMVAAGPYEIIRDALGELPVSYWVYPKDVPDAPRSFRKTPRMIDFFNATFGFSYPWAKYDQVCVAGYGGGMEATTATILGDGTIHDERADQDFSSEGLVAHELAHMWWGDLITERAWSDVWLSESFATYSEHLWARHDLGEDEGALDLEEKKSAYLEEARTRYIRPIVFNRFREPWEIMDGHSYPKGACVLHMLRFVMGDAPFFRAVSAFLRQYAFQSADTHDFMTVIKETTGQNLDWFFGQWIYSPGHPVFRVSWDWLETAKKVRLTVRQVQDFSKGIPVYRLPVLVGLRTAGDQRTERVWISGQEDTFEFEAPEKPLLVRFDEGNHLLKEIEFEKSASEWLYALRKDDAIGRVRAAEALARETGLAAARTGLEAAAKSDTFWAVRQAAVTALAARAEAPPDMEAFLKDRAHDGNSRVRAAAVRALGDVRGRGSVPFFKETFRTDPSYVVQSEALTALGRRGGLQDLGFLQRAAASSSPWGILRRSAEAAVRRIEASKGENPRVLIRTEAGDIDVEIYVSEAPVTAANFLRYVDAGLYDASTFHRTVTTDNQPKDLVRIEVVQGGVVPAEKCFPAIAHETTQATGIRHRDGTISMARSGPGSATSSFFFCLHDQPELDFGGRRNPDGQGFAAFGRVVSGMDVIRSIHGLPKEGQLLRPPVRILSVKRIGTS